MAELFLASNNNWNLMIVCKCQFWYRKMRKKFSYRLIGWWQKKSCKKGLLRLKISELILEANISGKKIKGWSTYDQFDNLLIIFFIKMSLHICAHIQKTTNRSDKAILNSNDIWEVNKKWFIICANGFLVKIFPFC